MGKPYPLAFRKRVVAAVESGGLSCNRAAKQFGIGISTAIGWVNRLRKTGSLAPGHKVYWCCDDRLAGLPTQVLRKAIRILLQVYRWHQHPLSECVLGPD